LQFSFSLQPETVTPHIFFFAITTNFL
jgi:hypothetical protein